MSLKTPNVTETIKKNTFLRWMLWILIAVMVAAGAEFLFNYKAIRNQNEVFEFQPVQSTEKGKLILEYDFHDSCYISKLQVCGSFQAEQKYTLEYTFINGFDREETVKNTDMVYPYYSEAWSPINELVTSLKITFPDSEKVSIAQLRAVTIPAVNWYRCLFVVLVVLFIAWIFFQGKAVLNYLEYLFVVYALGFGILMIAGAGPKYTTWDETVHFSCVHMLSYGKTVEWNDAARIEYESGLPEVNTKEELSLMKAYLDQQSEQAVSSEPNSNSFLKRGQFIYFPMVLFYQLGKILGFTFSNIYMLGRLGNLLVYIVLGFLAIHLAKKRKLLTAVILMFPTAVFQASMYTYDGLLAAMITLSVVLLMNETGSERRKPNVPAIIVAVFLILLACLIKPVYLPLLLLLLMVWKEKPGKKVVWAVGLIGLAAAVILALFLFPSVLAALQGNLMYGADVRGGETGIMAQLLSKLCHPFESIRLLIHEMLTMDNFRNLALKGMDDYLPTNLMLLNLGNLGCIKDEWSLILIPLLLLLFLVSPEKQGLVTERKAKRILGAGVLLSILAIWGAMYVTFTPVGASSIGGVQARYFIPLMLPVGFLLWNDCIVMKIKELTYVRIVLCGVLLLMGQCIWQLVITNRCV